MKTLSAISILSFVAASTAALASWPTNFTTQAVSATWQEPVGLTFAHDSRMFVWEKGGRVWLVENGVKAATPLLDVREEVGNWRDYGFLGFAIDPNFLSNGFIYGLYCVDYHYLRYFGTPTYDPGTSTDYHDTIARVTRWTCNASDGFRSVDYTTRTVLVGESMSTGIPLVHQSHGPGSLVFGRDGTLLVSAGDGASYDIVDHGGPIGGSSNTALADGIIRSEEDVGAFRSQMVNCHNGKVLRIDPASGDGVASNPFFDAAFPRKPASRVWALGLRNPYRMTLAPGTGSTDPAAGQPGTLLIGDVGWSAREEFNVCDAPAMNFGWPLYEGLEPHGGYVASTLANRDAANPLGGMSACRAWFLFQELLVQETLATLSWPNPCDPLVQIPASAPHFMHARPWIDYGHGNPGRTKTWNGNDAAVINVGASGSPVSGSLYAGFCALGGAWYTGTDFPPEWRNTWFVSDYASGWIQNLTVDAAFHPTNARPFSAPLDAGHPVALATDPTGGLWYVDYGASGNGSVRRIVYVNNLPPVAVASVDLDHGPTPVLSQFTGNASSDPESGALSYLWSFGDGFGSTQSNPLHVYDDLADVTLEGTIIARVLQLTPPHPLGSGNWDPEVIRDGDRPPLGSNDPARQYDTFHNGEQNNIDWIGYSFATPKLFRSLSFQEGMHFTNGGWLDTLLVQYSFDGVGWYNFGGLSVLPMTFNDNGWNYETYALTFNPVTASHIRLRSNPGGTGNFISVGELRVFATVLPPQVQRRDVVLTVTDNLGAKSEARLIVSPDNTAPSVQITSPLDGSFYPLTGNTLVALNANVTDAEHGASELTCRWQTILHHNEHVHPEPPVASCTTTSTITPIGCDGNTYFYEFRLTVADPGGLSTTVSSFVYPYCCLGAPLPSTYCMAKVNSQGCLPAIATSGMPSASGTAPFSVTATNIVNQKSGVLFYGLGPADVPFQGGHLCVASPLRRTPIQNSGGNALPPDCSGTFAFDFASWIRSGIDPALVPGAVVCGQYWYRDPLDPTGFGSGLTNAASFAICP